MAVDRSPRRMFNGRTWCDWRPVRVRVARLNINKDGTGVVVSFEDQKRDVRFVNRIAIRVPSTGTHKRGVYTLVDFSLPCWDESCLTRS